MVFVQKKDLYSLQKRKRRRGGNLQFEFYVLNYDFNKKKVVNYNIFNNIRVQEWTEKAVRKYLRAPKKFKYESFFNKEVIYGFDALVREIDGIIKWGEWSKREYEISVGDAFETDINKLEKWDTYSQAHANAEIITHTVLRQYKEQLKKGSE